MILLRIKEMLVPYLRGLSVIARHVLAVFVFVFTQEIRNTIFGDVHVHVQGF